jgi:hypothetical protein
MTVLSVGDLPVDIDLPFDRRDYNRSIMELRVEYRQRRFEASFQIAKVRILLGDTKEGLKVLQTVIDTIALESDKSLAGLEAKMRVYLGLLYEQLDRPLLAFREYRYVLDQLDSENQAAAQAVDRLRRRVQRDRSRDGDR